MHLWIIMDGNRRWAKTRLLPAIIWHKAGFDNAVDIIDFAKDKHIDFLTLWALSKENLVKREPEELTWIITLIEKLEDLIPRLQKNNIKFETIWDIEKLPQTSKDILMSVKEKTQNHTGMVLIVALVYSWQDEIIRAIQKLQALHFDVSNLTEQSFKQFLDTALFPAPDLIVRTGWDIRHSGFTLYDSAYSEYYFTNTLWPDFDEKELDKALDFFSSSKRNFGK